MAGENKVRPKGFKEWVENYWYHYKWPTIIVCVLALSLTVSIAQCTARPSYDYNVVIAFQSVELAPAQITAFETELSKYGTDQNGDGQVLVRVIDCSFNKDATYYGMALSKRQKLQTVLTSEQNMLIILSDKEAYEWLSGIRDEGFMANMGLPEDGGKYFSLTETEFYKNVKGAVSSVATWPKELRLSRRIVEGTLIENDKDVDKSMKTADDFIAAIVEKNS